MKIAVVQMNIESGHCENNFNKMVSYINQAKAEQADMVVFPQNAITGLYLGDQWFNHEFCILADEYNKKLIDLSDEIAIVWGNIRYRHHTRFNCAFFAYQRATRMTCKKNNHERFMDEGRYFKENSIDCEIAFQGESFKLNFGEKTEEDVINLNLDANPYQKDQELVFSNETIYVNAIGMQNIGKSVLVFAGGSGYYANEQTMARLAPCKESMEMIELNKKNELNPAPNLLEVMVYGIKEFDRQMFNAKLPWIIGLSGGLDSSVNAALLTMALGSERIFAYNMATRYNSDLTKQNAQQLADVLKLSLKNGSIEKLSDATLEVLAEYDYHDEGWNSLVKENIQARMRGHLLSTFAAIHGGVVINNGNKVEVALGYCTLYGDAIGALAPLGDCTKTDLFMISKQINAAYQKEVIPLSLLPEVKQSGIIWEMPPSAELKDQQLDPMKWFYHDLLLEKLLSGLSIEEYLESYLNHEILGSEFGPWLSYYGLLDPVAFIEDIQWFMNTMLRNGFKRIQVPPLMVLSNKAFGNDLLEVQGSFDAPKKQKLIEAILKMQR